MAEYGALAAGFLRGFANSRNAKKDREEADKYKKAMTQLLELQIDQARRSTQARTQVGEMMAPQTIAATPPEFQFPEEGQLGEIQTTKPAGPTIKPGMSFLEVMSDPQGRIAALESGLMEQMQAADEVAARAEFAKGIQESGMSPQDFLSSPEGGALAARVIRNPAEFIRAANGGMDPLQVAYQQAQIEKILTELGANREERTQENETRDKERRAFAVDTRSMVSKGQELADLNDRLEGTVLETGQPFGEIYRMAISGSAPVLEAFGFDMQKSRETVDDFQRFNKLAQDYVLELITHMENLGNLTEGKLQQLQDSRASIGTSPGANRKAIADAIQEALNVADVEEIDIPNRAEAEALIKELKNRKAPAAGEPVVDVPRITQTATGAARRVINFADLPE